MGFEDLFLFLNFYTYSSPIQWYFYPPITGFTHPNDGWMGLCIKLWCTHTSRRKGIITSMDLEKILQTGDQRWSNRTRVLVLEYEYFLSTRTRTRVLKKYSYSYSSTKESNRTRTRVHYQSNRTHDYFSWLNFFIWTVASKYIRQIKMAILEII